MIGRLTGYIAHKDTGGLLLDVGGVCYEISAPLSTLAALPALGQKATLEIHTHVREDDLRLFGFGTRRDKIAFRTMLRISGVGPKMALAVLGALSGEQLSAAIRDADTRRLCAVPGVGKKTAERMILELGGKLELGDVAGEEPSTESVFGDLSSALKNLGFKAAQVERVISELKKEHEGKEMPFGDMLRKALLLVQEKNR